MYCPRCSQEQITENLKFCSRCGFPLAVVSEVVAHGGTLPQLAALSKNKTVLTRRNGKILALFWALFFLLMLVPLFDISKIPELASMAAVIGVFGGLLILLASIFFLPKASEKFDLPQIENGAMLPQNLKSAASNAGALPPQQSIPAAAFVPAQSNRRDTNDFVQPPSVTENTTKLLEREDNL